MGINANITNDLAKVVGLIAKKHDECSIEIEWREGTPEQEWIVTATNGSEDFVYVVDDESGTWMPANERELELIRLGRSVFASI